MSVLEPDVLSLSGRVFLAIDDVHPANEKESDFGSLEPGSNLSRLLDVASDFPWLKVVLFVVANWRYRGCGESWADGTFLLSHNSGWCEQVRGMLDRLPNVAIGMHGWTHCRSTIECWKEFEGASDRDTGERLARMVAEFRESGLPYRQVFRPPGWAFSKGQVSILQRIGVLTFLGDYCIEEGTALPGGRTHWQASWDQEVLHVPANYDIGWSNVDRALSILSLGGVLSICGHVTNSAYGHYIGSGPEPTHLFRLRNLLRKLEQSVGHGTLKSEWPDELTAPARDGHG
jgi:hypothetical protein